MEDLYRCLISFKYVSLFFKKKKTTFSLELCCDINVFYLLFDGKKHFYLFAGHRQFVRCVTWKTMMFPSFPSTP